MPGVEVFFFVRCFVALEGNIVFPNGKISFKLYMYIRILAYAYHRYFT